MITFVAALDQNVAIGKKGGTPWHVPEDMAFFKKATLGGAVIMGRKTWGSLPRKPLPDRDNIVVTSGLEREENGAFFTDVDGALARAKASGKEIKVIGGEQIFRQMFPVADRLLLSYVDLKIEGTDAFFPEFDRADWTEVRRKTLRSEDPNCVLIEYVRQQADLT